MSKGANIDATDAFGVTPLLAAVYEGTNDIKFTVAFLSSMISNRMGSFGQKDHTDMVKFLVGKGANKTTKGSDGKTAQESTSNPDILALL